MPATAGGPAIGMLAATLLCAPPRASKTVGDDKRKRSALMLRAVRLRAEPA